MELLPKRANGWLTVNSFCKKPYFRCLIGFWLCSCHAVFPNSCINGWLLQKIVFKMKTLYFNVSNGNENLVHSLKGQLKLEQCLNKLENFPAILKAFWKFTQRKEEIVIKLFGWFNNKYKIITKWNFYHRPIPSFIDLTKSNKCNDTEHLQEIITSLWASL